MPIQSRRRGRLLPGKRGFFFTVIALLMMLLVFFTLSIESSKQHREQALVTAVRLSTMSDFIASLEDDMSRALYISGFRAMLTLVQEVISTGAFLEDADNALLQAVVNGTVGNATAPLMENSTFTLWIAKIEQNAVLMDVNVSIVLGNITLVQDDPWEIDLRAQVAFNVSDMKRTSSWYREKEIVAHVPLIGLEDPVYAVNSYGLLTNTVIPANITDFVDEATNDTAGLQLHLNHSYYLASPDAPTFLMRLEGNLSASPFGIESLINLNGFIEQGIPISERSAVDYIYFSNVTHTPNRIWNMSTLPDWNWFRLDNSSLGRYECGSLVIP